MGRLLLIFCLLGLGACAADSSASFPPATTGKVTAMFDGSEEVFFFKADKKVEIYRQKKIIHSFTADWVADSPTGIFTFDPQRKVLLAERMLSSGSSPEYRLSETALEQLLAILPVSEVLPVYILPNDSREDGYLEPCFACPHYAAEVYATLEMYLAQHLN